MLIIGKTVGGLKGLGEEGSMEVLSLLCNFSVSLKQL